MYRLAYLDTAPIVAGDHVRIIAPAGPVTAEQLDRAVRYCRGWGCEVSVGEHVLAGHPSVAYLSASDGPRRADLVAAWTDPDVDVVLCARGGFGSMRLLDALDWALLRDGTARRDGRPTLLAGSSDITALHEAFALHLDVPTLFCPMPATDDFDTSPTIRADVRRWLFEPWRGRDLIGPATETMVAGRAAGRLGGGTLSLLAAGVGSPEAAARSGELLLLEDVDEEPYRLDNLLVQLDRSGRLAAAGAVVLGSWRDCGDPAAVREVMDRYLSGLGVPVLWQQGFGHDPDALSVPLNVGAILDATGDGRPTLTVGALPDAPTAPFLLPPLDTRARWSVRIVNAADGAVLAEHTPDVLCKTASIGKIFLLIEVARRLESGELSPEQRITVPPELHVRDSGLLHMMAWHDVAIADAALLVGAVSDNLATNALIHLCGLDAVRAVAPALGYRDTTLVDYIRSERLPGMPWTASCGTGAELADLMRRLGEGDTEESCEATILTPGVRARVLEWLAAGADTSMVAGGMRLDPLAHVDPVEDGVVLRHKTGTIDTARIDVGHVAGPTGRVAYAVAANWDDDVASGHDMRSSVLGAMDTIGERIRARVTGRG
ncbi:muramoyltetrapeptide carboxypeptidase LdcA involved in peptidoglycan recycling/beta-lactamase class A [Gordonia amarae]|uniref:serine hydrolase n=1 Tax=Gordonia amarae TaxID=36821 RepID=UPI0002FCC09A|nr:serine hydrolase [Gordonia amarae]MCS3878413.1 muramoyltetrapeptide carboxypeptidase LdcA involved in peptidoglycan recycling/beta-lactamase class A [Gordonia amarae]